MSTKLFNGSAEMSLPQVVAFFHNVVEVVLRFGRLTSTDPAEAKSSSFTSIT